MKFEVTVIGGGLAGCEAAWQLAKFGIKVKLFEMRPVKNTPCHKTSNLAELVCSNSFGATEETTPGGILKAELRFLDSLIISCADKCRLPAGSALAVDRIAFSKLVTEKIESNSLITVIRKEILDLPDGFCIIATGPVTSLDFSEKISSLTGKDFLYFFDAVSPVVSLESIDLKKAFWLSRYEKGKDYLNCPLTKEEYENFVYELANAEQHPLHDFEKDRFFEGCLPVEELAKRGVDTLRFGPLSPKGLKDPDGFMPYAVLQLRPENKERTMLNLVGCQTNLTWSEQKRVFRMIPALSNAEFLRFGVMHRNIFLNAPVVLSDGIHLKTNPRILFAGQITGTEGYTESCASGLAAGLTLALSLTKNININFPEETAIGSLLKYLKTADSKNFQPMNFNLGLLPPLQKKIHNRAELCKFLVQRSLKSLEKMLI